MQPPVAGAGRPTRRPQYLLKLAAIDGAVGHLAHDAPCPDCLENGVDHGAFPPRQKRATRCWATDRHTESRAAVYPAGSAVRTAMSGICLSGPVSKARVSGETRSMIKS